MWRMLQQGEPDDYVVATGETHTVREFTEVAFGELGMRLAWEGEGPREVGRDAESGAVRVRIDPAYYRPTEVDLLIGDPRKAREKLGWEASVRFDELARMMARADYEKVLKRGF
jgi:GDPmannose 4,6-dehydratase